MLKYIGELYFSLNKCKNNRSPGSDDLSNEFLKNLPPNWIHYILDMLNKIINTETTPKSWSLIQMSLVHKKCPKNNPYKYRGIVLIVSICKIFTQILHSRLETWIEEAGILMSSKWDSEKTGVLTIIYFPHGHHPVTVKVATT